MNEKKWKDDSTTVGLNNSSIHITRNPWALRRMEQIPFHKQYVGAARPQEYGKGGACDHSWQEKKKDN